MKCIHPSQVLAVALGLFFSAGCAINPSPRVDITPDNTRILSSVPFDGLPSNPNVSADAAAALKYLAALSRGPYHGTIVGQACAHGNEICMKPVPPANDYFTDSFEKLVQSLHDGTGKWVGMIDLEYECGNIFTSAQLSQGNKVLIDYWNAGGLIQITWCALNPWVNNESDIVGNPGNWKDAFYTQNVDMRALINPKSPMRKVWLRKLDRVATALTELRDAGVVVLWRPLQECTGGWYWYGSRSHPRDPSPYIKLWRDMYRYFTDVRKLDNLLWVYAPAAYGGSPSGGRKPVDWIYPGAKYTDIVAGTTYNDGLSIEDYQSYLAMGKPLGMSELGPTNESANGSFDDRTYINRLKNDYPRIAYWVTWENWPSGWSNGKETYTLMSLVSNLHASELMNDPSVITRDDINWKSFR